LRCAQPARRPPRRLCATSTCARRTSGRWRPTRGARSALEQRLGDEGVVRTDRISGAARLVARTDGILTAPSGEVAAQVALDYVRAQSTSFGLDGGDSARWADEPLSLLRRRDAPRVDAADAAIAACDNVVYANVARDGRLLNGGSPVDGLAINSAAPSPKNVSRARSPLVKRVARSAPGACVARGATIAPIVALGRSERARRADRAQRAAGLARRGDRRARLPLRGRRRRIERRGAQAALADRFRLNGERVPQPSRGARRHAVHA
jgi:hypothetical protein